MEDPSLLAGIYARTQNPALDIHVYARWQIDQIAPPPGRFIVVSITDSDRRTDRVDLTNLGVVPFLRLGFRAGGPPAGLADEQADRFWRFLKDNLDGLDTILLHCGAGGIRSPALALAVVRAFAGDERLLLAETQPDEATFATAARAFPRVFGRPLPTEAFDPEEGT